MFHKCLETAWVLQSTHKILNVKNWRNCYKGSKSWLHPSASKTLLAPRSRHLSISDANHGHHHHRIIVLQCSYICIVSLHFVITTLWDGGLQVVISIFWWGNWNSGRSNDLPKCTLLIGGRKKIWIHLTTLDPESLFIASCVVVVQSLSHIQLFVTPSTAACKAPLSSTISQSLLKFMSIESVMLFNHLILHPLLLSIFPSIPVFSNIYPLQPESSPLYHH